MSPDKYLNWAAYFWVKKGPRRKRVLKFVYESSEPVTPTMVKKVLKMPITNASSTLIQLKEYGILKCLNPEKYQGKRYAMTPSGKIVYKKLQKIV